MIAGELFDPRDAELVQARRRARQLCRALLDADDGEHGPILQQLLGAGGETAQIEPPFVCHYGWNILLGAHVTVSFDCVILDDCEVRIGSHAHLGPGVHVYTPQRPFDARSRRHRGFGRPVEIGDDVWIGGRTLILPGVHIGEGAVIGAGSVVTRDVPPRVLALGNPCRVVRRIPG